MIALIEQRSRGRVLIGETLQLLVDFGDLGQRIVRRRHRIADAGLCAVAQSLNALRCRIQLLSQSLRGIEHAGARRLRVGACRKRLKCSRERVERGFDRRGRIRIAVDALQIAQEVRAGLGIGCSGRFSPKLALDVVIENAVDADGVDTGAGADCSLHLIGGLADVTRRFRVRHIGRNQRKRRLICPQAGHRG